MENGSFITLHEAARLSPGNPHSATVWRWCRKGIKCRTGDRIHLEHVRVGGKIYVREPDLDAFFQNVADADRRHFDAPAALPPDPRPTARQRQKSVERAEKTLSGAGIL